MNIINLANQYIDGLKDTLERVNLDQFNKIVSLILSAYDNGNNIFVMGNGGSGSTASHFACDINKGCCIELNKKFKMICLNDNIPTLLAFANDVSYDVVFVEQMKNFFNQDDLVIGISGSGNSKNVINAITYASENGGHTIGLSGFSGGKLSQIVDVAFIAEVDDMQKVEDIHMIVVHIIMQTVYKCLHDPVQT